jgi:two-component system, OmpR family, response regulator CpxR
MQNSPPHILLIDDNEHGLIARRTVLEDAGYVVTTASSGRQGLARFCEQPFDLVVTDYRMPDMAGLKVVRKIREHTPRVPVVILSGYVEPLGLTEESTGADAVLSKGPTEERDLIRTIGRLFKKKPGSQRARAKAARHAGR